jgi:hypothetical protein
LSWSWSGVAEHFGSSMFTSKFTPIWWSIQDIFFSKLDNFCYIFRNFLRINLEFKMLSPRLYKLKLPYNGQDRSQELGSSSPMQEDGNGEKLWCEVCGAHHNTGMRSYLATGVHKLHTVCQTPGCLYDVISSSRSIRWWKRKNNWKKGWRRRRRTKRLFKLPMGTISASNQFFAFSSM